VESYQDCVSGACSEPNTFSNILSIVGGIGDLSYRCSGGRQDERCKCFDVRLMWRYIGQLSWSLERVFDRLMFLQTWRQRRDLRIYPTP
jgi:hypothetical protein